MIDEYKVKKIKSSISFILVVFLFIGGYTFFFTSRYWMPVGSDAERLTKLNVVNAWDDDREVTIIRWDYCEKSSSMEVELDIKNLSFDGNNTYDFSAVESINGKMKVETVLEEADWVIIRLTELPKRWSEISLRIDKQEPDEDDTTLKVYTNVNDVNRVEQIIDKDINGYRKGRFEMQLAAYQKQISDVENEIQSKTEYIEEIQGEIARLETEKQYQTEEQKAETDKLIADANSRMASEQEAIVKLQDEIVEVNERIAMLQRQMEEVLN